jgi:hypothetical protein
MAGTFYFETERVRRNTPMNVNHRIDEQIIERIRHYANQPVDVITARIEQLEREWDVERVLETNASAAALTSLALGLTVNRKWLLLTAGVMGFLLLHGLQGWCPPLPVIRRVGVRTRNEIDREKFALKYLRGDFDTLRSGKKKDAWKLASDET